MVAQSFLIVVCNHKIALTDILEHVACTHAVSKPPKMPLIL